MERDQQRIAEQELRDKERAQLLKNIEEMKKEDERQAKEKKQRVNKLMEQVAASNKESLAQKELKVIQEKKLEAEIVEYNRQKILREEEALLEEKRKQEEKEKEIQRLRELQEKANDRQAEIDALKAKRAYEEGERIARERDRQEVEKRRKIAQELEVARQKQFKYKEQ